MARSPARRDHGHSRDYRDDRDRSRRRDRSRSRERRRGQRDYDRAENDYGRLNRDDHYGDRSRREGHLDRHRGNSLRSDREGGRRGTDNRRRSSSRDSRGSKRHYRERSPVRDNTYPRRPREGDDLHVNGRDHKRPRRGSREPSETPSRPGTSSGKVNRPEPNSTPAEHAARVAAQKAQEERQKKVAAWKARQVQKPTTSASTPVAESPSSSRPGTSVGSPAPAIEIDTLAESTRPKFDPKAIKKQTQGKSKSEQATLDSDAPLPALATRTIHPGTFKGVARPNFSQRGHTVDRSDAKIAGFGLNKAGGDKPGDKSATTKASTTLDEDEGEQRKFKKLPDLALESATSDAALADDQEDEDEGDDEFSSDEEEAEAARQAAIKRAADAQAAQQDTAMTDVVDEAPAIDGGAMEVDEDVDPLDAFMSTLDEAPSHSRAKPELGEPKTRLFDDDEGPDLDAVGDNPEDLLNAVRRKKKDIPAVDHSKIEYEPFRKNFYTESLEVKNMTDEDVATLRAEMDNITVRGIDPPKPIMKWSQAGFGAQILDVIRENKFDTLTSIQSQALPSIMSGRDTIGIAKTGSGKTLAFILPMFRHIKDQRPVANLEGPIGLIMAPTRELAVQIHRECKPYLKALNLRGVCAYGGAPITEQIADFKRGAEVVVCTPGRLIDLLGSNSGRVTNLRRATYVVMDEADRMFDMGFEPQITKVLGNVRPDRQTVLFSATFPKKMESLARKALNRPVEIVVGGRSVVAAEITQKVEVRTEETKFRRVLELLGDLHETDEDARSLIFVERQETADNLFKELTKKGYPSVSVHGGREQIDRDQAVLDFKSGAIPVMVATSVAARGLDVKQLKLVINYDSPNHGEDYVHRAGRTGRAGNTGTAVTFVTPDQERYAGFLVRCLEDSKNEVPEELKQMAATHKKKVAAGEASRIGSGFGGHGIERLDAARAAERAREKNMFKTGDEAEDENEDAKKEKSKKESEVEKLVSKAAGKVTERDAVKEQGAELTAEQSMRRDLLEHLNNALKVKKAEKPAAAPLPKDPIARALAAAASINSRLGTRGSARPGAPTDNRGPDAGAFHSHLEINDFPQKARWAVTNRTNVAKVLEATGTSITSKGEYYPPGKDPGPGDPPKLYILVEGDTDVAVQAAMRELSRHLTEGTLQAQEAEARGGTSGRYRVI